jgi:hypothetical protein
VSDTAEMLLDLAGMIRVLVVGCWLAIGVDIWAPAVPLTSGKSSKGLPPSVNSPNGDFSVKATGLEVIFMGDILAVV